MIRHLATLVTIWAMLWGGAAMAQAAPDEHEIDREALIFVIEDAAVASALSEDANDLDLMIRGAIDWILYERVGTNALDEALQNARAVLTRAETELPALRARLAAMPVKGPELLPVFYWNDGWVASMSSWLGEVLVRKTMLAHLEESARAEDVHGVLTLYRLYRGLWTEWQKHVAEDIAQVRGYVPAGHPDQFVLVDYADRAEISALFEELADPSSLLVPNAVWSRLATQYDLSSKAVVASAADLSASLPAHRANLVPFAQALTGDADTAEALSDAIIASYRESKAALLELAEVFAGMAATSQDMAERGPAPDGSGPFSGLEFRETEALERLAEGVTARTKLWAEALETAQRSAQ